VASSAPAGAATIVLAFIDKCPQKLKALGCRNALVSDAYLQRQRASVGHWRAAAEKQQTSCQCWRRSNTANGAATELGQTAARELMRPRFAFSSTIRKSCESGGLRIVVPSEQDPALSRVAFDEALKNSWRLRTYAHQSVGANSFAHVAKFLILAKEARVRHSRHREIHHPDSPYPCALRLCSGAAIPPIVSTRRTRTPRRLSSLFVHAPEGTVITSPIEVGVTSYSRNRSRASAPSAASGIHPSASTCP